MSDEVTFSPDLFRGKAEYYDRFRRSYPDALISDLVRRTGASGQGRLLDLACGTGQLAFALRSSFAEVWAADQEPDMVAVVAAKAAAGAGASAGRRERGGTGRAARAFLGRRHRQRLPPASPGPRRGPGARLAEAGRLPRAVLVAGYPGRTARLAGRLRRSAAPVAGGARRRRPRPRQLGPGAAATARRRRADRGRARADRPTEFLFEHRWTLPELAGFARTLSVLPTAALADQPPPSTIRCRPSSGATRPTASSPRRSASPTNWPASPA